MIHMNDTRLIVRELSFVEIGVGQEDYVIANGD
jgi:hypothetical protein